ncbi:MAG: phosphotransferase enzyme family protein [Pseudomonadota bacterium]
MSPDSPAFLALVQQTARTFGVDAVSVALVSHSENLVYRVQTDRDQTFALRLHRPGYHSLAELEAEQQWTAALNDAGISVPVGEPTVVGHYYKPVVLPTGEERFAGLVGWRSGVPLFKVLADNPGLEQVTACYSAIGKLTGRLHNQAANWQVPANFQRHSLDADGLMGETPFWGPFWDLPEYDRQTSAEMREARRVLHHALSRLDKNPAHYSMIHADLHGSNLLVDGDAITVIDFDDAGFGWHVYDMAVSLFAVGDHPQAAEIRAAWVAGYRTVRELPDAHLELYSLFRLVRGLASLGWAHHRREVDRREAIAWTLAVVQSLLPDFI